MKKKMNNKGFSLVELIVVVAIMAVLIGILAPQYLRYVERTRLQKDNTAVAEIANAMKIAVANENVYNSINFPATVTLAGTEADGSGNKTVTFPASGDNTATPFTNELRETLGTTVTTQSNVYKDSQTPIVLSISAEGQVTVTGWIEAKGENPITKNL